MAKKKETPKIPAEQKHNPEAYWEIKKNLDKKGRKLFVQQVYEDWCKACGICVAFCPEEVFDKNRTGTPVVINADACTGCRFCEFHCPDFAISIRERFPDRRKKKDGT